MPLVTLGDDFCTYHINHVPTIRDTKRPKVKENLEYAARNGGYLASNGDAPYTFSGRKFCKINEQSWELPKYVPKGNAPPGEL